MPVAPPSVKVNLGVGTKEDANQAVAPQTVVITNTIVAAIYVSVSECAYKTVVQITNYDAAEISLAVKKNAVVAKSEAALPIKDAAPPVTSFWNGAGHMNLAADVQPKPAEAAAAA